MRYRTATAFRDALEHRLNAQATARQNAVNVLRKQVAIDRFLSRLTGAAPSRWIVKGAYAIDLRLGACGHATRDVDLARRDDAAAALRDMRDASAVDVCDFFRFAAERSRRNLRRDVSRASRFHFAADLTCRRFDIFTVDAREPDGILDTEELTVGDTL